jgi:microcystin-dependent protein
MSDQFIGQIQLFSFNFAPYQWAFCAGQLMPIQQNTALFSLLGVSFGGNGTSSFGLPNFQGQAACGVGQGPGLSQRDIGEMFGTEAVQLTSNQLASHNHTVSVFNQHVDTKRHGTPQPQDAITLPTNIAPFTTDATSSGNFPAAMLGANTTSNLPHANQQPYLAMNFCIALSGVFPTRP